MAEELARFSPSPLIMWVLGILGSLIVLYLTIEQNRDAGILTRLTNAEATLTQLTERVKHLERQTEQVQQTHVARTEIIAGLRERIALLEQRLTGLDHRLTTVSEELLKVLNRLQQALPHPQPPRHPLED
jgi:chromosome segregation ATPase